MAAKTKKKPKVKWTKKIPKESGWYWFTHYGKHGKTLCPAEVYYIKFRDRMHTFVNPASGQLFTDDTREMREHARSRFGPRIPMPEEL